MAEMCHVSYLAQNLLFCIVSTWFHAKLRGRRSDYLVQLLRPLFFLCRTSAFDPLRHELGGRVLPFCRHVGWPGWFKMDETHCAR